MSASHTQAIDRLVAAIETIVAEAPDAIVARVAEPLAALVATDDWIDPAFAAPDPERYRQYLLYRDPADRFSVVSFVWGPGQATPIHDHRVWGLVGVLRGAEIDQRYARTANGALVFAGPPTQLDAGDVATLSPESGDIHQVSNAFADRVSISIHVYGADIGRVERATYDATGAAKPFISGYAQPASVFA
uniref:cysteine dioxygenase family protein n=1 Tax=uncultured Sphingomonas sp. TaxID=158754 RepID=UPI0035CB247F